MTRKIILAFTLFLCIATASAQNLQLHYDFRKSLHGKEVASGNYLTSTFEMFKPDKWGSTFMFVDFDYSLDRGNIGLVYGEIARDFKIGNCPVMPHIEFNGGLGNGFSIDNAYLVGASYPFKVGNFFMSTYVAYKLNAFMKTSHDAQWTMSWTGTMFDNILTFSGFVDVWSENKNKTGVGPTSGKRIVFLSEPQLWLNVTDHFSIGSEVELSYNFINAYKESKFYAMPTIAAKWNF